MRNLVRQPGRRRALVLTCFLPVALACGEDPTAPENIPTVVDEVSLIAALAEAYASMDAARFESHLANEPGANAVFEFTMSSQSAVHDTWPVETETSLHRRMFRPSEIPSSDPPLSPELWLTSVDVTLVRQTDFVERHDFYQASSNPGGVDEARWRVTSADYVANVHFLASGTNFAVQDGDAEFIVIEDRERETGDPGKFRLLAWNELCLGQSIRTSECWGTVKALYRQMPQP